MASPIEQLAKNFSLASFKRAKDLKKRIWFTLFILVIYRLGTYIPLPSINPAVVSEFTRSHAGGLFGVLDMFSGGAIGRMTVFSLNIMPYISASIIVQLLTAMSPQLTAMKKEGESGRRKLNQYTRYGTVALAMMQGYGIAVGLERMMGNSGPAVLDPGMLFRFTTMTSLTGGTLFIMWLGEQISSRGLGNGSSIIIYSGIVCIGWLACYGYSCNCIYCVYGEGCSQDPNTIPKEADDGEYACATARFSFTFKAE